MPLIKFAIRKTNIMKIIGQAANVCGRVEFLHNCKFFFSLLQPTFLLFIQKIAKNWNEATPKEKMRTKDVRFIKVLYQY